MHQQRNNAFSNGLFEQLETRRLLSGASVNDAGTLLVSGSNHSDKIAITLEAGDSTKLDVVINGVTSTFNVADITGGVKVFGKNGKDKINVLENNGAVDLNCTMFGGNGKDIMCAGSGDDSLDGGSGNDKLFGGSGNDVCFGGNGKDDIDGQDGNDHLLGGRGEDKLDGGDGDDDLDGGKEQDEVHGGAGNDDFSHNDSSSEDEDHTSDDNGDNTNDDAHDDHGDDSVEP